MAPSDETRPEQADPLVEQTAAIDGSDLLDWDARIETAPQRPSGKVKVGLKYRGRGTPIPVEISNGDAPKA